MNTSFASRLVLASLALSLGGGGRARAQQVQNTQANQTNIYFNAPAPQYYAPAPPPPPPQYVVVAPPAPPKSGLGDIIAGSILLPLGLVAIGGSVPLWSHSSGAAVGGAVALDIAGAVMGIVGLVEIPVGAVRMVRHREWQERQQRPLAAVSLTPAASASPDGFTLALRGRF